MPSVTPADQDPHAFEPAPPTASRSPCPALNAAASHGYLPRSGRNISVMQFVYALRTAYNISLPLALLLSVGAFLLCGRNGTPSIPFWATIDLHDLARHGRIEHNGSLAHGDTERGATFAPCSPDQTLLSDLINEAKEGKNLTMEDVARVRNRRDEALILRGVGLDWVHGEISRGEAALLLAVMGDGKEVSPQKLKQWMGEDRLPDGWERPKKSLGFIGTVVTARKVGALMKQEGTGKPLKDRE